MDLRKETIDDLMLNNADRAHNGQKISKLDVVVVEVIVAVVVAGKINFRLQEEKKKEEKQDWCKKKHVKQHLYYNRIESIAKEEKKKLAFIFKGKQKKVQKKFD
ncbi:Hypothetical predicted protein [Octopus vulgaris]|uniref:Uncharacterized protein n=1 Tax=Octopus vulgaris TaxID=6645 RepID=A0AA36F201_OCTVU|nr:Hypothetical predicted protein [Octopus vulgaris]